MKKIIALSAVLIFFQSCTNNKTGFEKYANAVTIYRDEFGVAHVAGETDEAAVFGFAYSQAEDNFFQVEENFIRAVGRASEIFGEETLLDDWLNRALEIPKISKKNFEESDSKVQQLCKAFADGLNYYLEKNPSVKPKLMNKFEPWYSIALIKYLYYQRGFLFGDDYLKREDFQNAFNYFSDKKIISSAEKDMLDENRLQQGSNSWAVNGKKSKSGNALLFINPHLPFFGPSQVYEGHVISNEGWNFTGYARFGFPFPYVGFNEKLGWASTDNYADLQDIYFESFDDENNMLNYKYDNSYRQAEEWSEKIKIKAGKSFIEEEFRFLKTHHGAITAIKDNKFLAVKMTKFNDPGWLDEWYFMTKSQTLKEFKNAVSKLNMLFGNYLYADAEDNIFYVYNGAVPVRSEKFNWTKPVDGSSVETEWKGYHKIEELPQLLNPETGWIQNCNGTPFFSTSAGNPNNKNFPSYMVTEGDNERHERARQILSSQNKFTFEEWEKLSYDKFVLKASKDVPLIIKEWNEFNKSGKNKNHEIAEAINILKNWDFRSNIESVAMTLYCYWGELLYENKELEKGKFNKITALTNVIEKLKNTWGTWKKPWGEIQRLQRVNSNGTGFNDNKNSFASDGVPSWAGGMFTMWSRSYDNQKKLYGFGGNSYVSVIEFAPKIKAKSLHVFGSSADSASRYFTSQSERYIKGNYKPAWVTLKDVERNAVESYHPAENRSR